MSLENDNEFLLIAYDPETAFSPRRVRLLSSTCVGDRTDFVWADSDSPLPGIEVTQSQVLLAPRHFGFSVSGSLSTPPHVYVCNVAHADMLLRTVLMPEAVSIMYWAILSPLEFEDKTLVEILEAMTETQGNVYSVNPVHQ